MKRPLPFLAATRDGLHGSLGREFADAGPIREVDVTAAIAHQTEHEPIEERLGRGAISSLSAAGNDADGSVGVDTPDQQRDA